VLVLVPKAPVNKDYLPQTRKREIGSTRESSLVQSETEAEAVAYPPHDQFGLCVRFRDASHNAGARFRREPWPFVVGGIHRQSALIY
jgi:hypothetical protein